MQTLVKTPKSTVFSTSGPHPPTVYETLLYESAWAQVAYEEQPTSAHKALCEVTATVAATHARQALGMPDAHHNARLLHEILSMRQWWRLARSQQGWR